ncbi:MAG: sel1 repeat family protein [Erysipelotrichaceae bacterium]|nr:sel1 repeat family protein [Erysipelotrichaceae bacterium]
MFRRQNSTKYYQDGLTKEWFGDHKEAFKLFLKAAELDNTEAQVKVADYYRVGIYTEQNLPEALYLYEKAAEKGDSLGQFYCAEMYYYGQGCEPDTDTAMYWLDRARKENNWDTGMEALKNKIKADQAAAELAERKARLMKQAISGDRAYELYLRMIDSGNELYDIGKAETMLQKAVDFQYEPAMWEFVNRKMAAGSRSDREEAVKVLTSLAETDDKKAILQLYDLYLNDSFFRNSSLAYKWGCRAQDLGLIDQDYELGMMIRSGDPERALEHFLLAAQKNDERAYRVVYEMYANGEGCEKDEETAFLYYTEAAHAGTASRTEYLRAAEKLENNGNIEAYYEILYESALQDGNLNSLRKCCDLCRSDPGRRGDLEQFLRKACELAAAEMRDLSPEVDELTEYYEEELKNGYGKNQMLTKAVNEKDDWAFVSRLWALENTGTSLEVHNVLLAFYKFNKNSFFEHWDYKQYLPAETNDQKINELLENGFRLGDTEQLYVLAMRYAGGIGIEKNRETAAQLLETAKQLGHPDAAGALEALTLSDAEQEGMARVLEKYRNQMKAPVQIQVAGMYRTGKGTPYSERKWIRHLANAAECGDVASMMKVAEYYENLPLFYQETGEAVNYYAMAADRGNSEAAFRIGNLLENDVADPVLSASCWEYYLLAEKRGHEQAHAKCEELRACAGDRYAEGARFYQAGDYENMTAYWYPLVLLDNSRVIDLTADLFMKNSVELSFDMEYNVLTRVLKKKADKDVEEHLAWTLAENGYFKDAVNYGKKALEHGSITAYWLLYRVYMAMNDEITAKIYLYEGGTKGNGYCCMVHARECVEEYNETGGTESLLRSARHSLETAVKWNVRGAAELLKEVNRVLGIYQSERDAAKAEYEYRKLIAEREAEYAEMMAEEERLYDNGTSWLDFARTVEGLYDPLKPFTAYDSSGNAYKVDPQTGRGVSYNGSIGHMSNDDLADRARRLKDRFK